MNLSFTIVETKKDPDESAVLNIGGENSDYDPIQ